MSKVLSLVQARSIQVYHPGGNIAFDVLAPRREDIKIDTIAHALSNICRFNGNCKDFYSVAQHSVMVSKICLPNDALEGLLHDASEAYIGDLVQPLKKYSGMFDEYEQVEAKLQQLIYDTFEVVPHINSSCRQADLLALAYEKRDLMSPAVEEIWAELPVIPAHGWNHIFPLPPKDAKEQFLERWLELTEDS
jgi:5'-deoxynucleotidase YfbR-like HD superfamily hydrolase